MSVVGWIGAPVSKVFRYSQLNGMHGTKKRDAKKGMKKLFFLRPDLFGSPNPSINGKCSAIVGERAVTNHGASVNLG
jgi:hypothetical protein